MKPQLNLLLLDQHPIFSQLELEEALLRTSDENYAIINLGSSPAVVMGISGKKEELVESHCTLDIIKRFSGGGCVVVDENTLFFTLIVSEGPLEKAYPEAILEYAQKLLSPLFEGLGFKLRTQDFALENRKIGGNALYIRKERWLIHTSFLWDYKDERMNLLKMPQKTPEYRKGRSHQDFVTTLNQYFSDPITWQNSCIECLKQDYEIVNASFDELKSFKSKPHRKANKLL